MSLPKVLTTVTPLSKALAFILFITMPILAFYAGVQYQNVIVTDLSYRSMISAPISPTPKINEVKKYVGTYHKTQFDIKLDMVENVQHIPKELDMNDDLLVGMNCTTDLDPAMIQGTQLHPVDKRLIQYKDTVQKKYSPEFTIHNGFYCDTEDGRTIFTYETVSLKNNQAYDAYISLVDRSGNVSEIDKIPIKELQQNSINHYYCDRQLLLTKSGLLYYQCVEGESGSIVDFIEINLKTKTHRVESRCESHYSDGPSFQMSCYKL